MSPHTVEVDKNTFEDGMAKRRVSVYYLPNDSSIVGTGKAVLTNYIFLFGGFGLLGTTLWSLFSSTRSA